MPLPGLHLWQRATQLYTRDIWRNEYLDGRSPRARLYAFLRVVSITLTGINETKTPSRSAALSFATLLGLGPLMAIAVLVAGFVLDRQDPDLAVNTLNKLIKFVAPQITQYEQLENEKAAAGQPAARRTDIVTAATLNLPPAAVPSTTPPTTSSPSALPSSSSAPPDTPPDSVPDSAPVPVNPELVEMINGFITGSKSSTAGIVGIVTLIVIVLQLFTSVENAFNEIWGVRQGRSWLMRVVYYWTVLTLGAVLFFALVTSLSAGAYLNLVEKSLPFGLGGPIVEFLRLLLPSLSGVMLMLVLALFYKFIPNTRVLWRSAAVGAILVSLLLVANNYLAFLYLSKVVQQRSLFGSLGILPILMFGLYIFWFFLLVGGQVSYAIQNVHFRNSQAAWNTLAESMRERLSLTVLLRIGRRFRDCRPAITASELGTQLGVPTQILNECLNRLVHMRLLTPVPAQKGDQENDLRYQPARPLNRTTLADFKRLDDDHGGDPTGPTLTDIDPIVLAYDNQLNRFQDGAFFQKNLDELIDAHPMHPSGT
ncbi:MAG: YihY/virulence factor BrkB family protein [Burkholderiales bacterium]|nr:YihY/virulence factor BrkB family protein [Opitutaceae bacterium]